MRKSKAETAKTRERILEAASAQFLSHGITDAGLARLMRAAGLTRGGFYRHFTSKDQLVAEACSQAVLSLTSGLKSQIEGRPPDPAVTGTSRRPVVSLPHSGVNWRADATTREAAAEGFPGLSRLIAGQLRNVPAKRAEVQSMAIAAAMIGAITLARMVPHSRISNSILVGTRDHILKSVRRKR